MSGFPWEPGEGRDSGPTDGEIWSQFGVVTQPSFAFIGDDGELVEVETGALGEDGLTARMQELVDA